MRKSVDERVEDDGRFGKVGWNGCRHRGQLRVVRSELSYQRDDGVRSPGRQVDEDERDDDLSRADFRLSPEFAERAAVLVDADHLTRVRQDGGHDATVTGANHDDRNQETGCQ